ncbi:MAG: ATP-binding cassette domain-containing protein [Sphingomonadales bacterium]|nr:ATP-binding cassette domain-containing protein [Sphingomonadales bacterium]
MIRVENLHKSFGGVPAVDGLGFTAKDGEITGLIGHNGAGKTTTFRILAGLMHPDAGTARIDDCDVAAGRVAAQRRLGILPDVRGLYPRLTAREHIRYYGGLHGLEGAALEERIGELITRLGMEEFADRRAKGYSRGQELKVALARALVHAPRNLILDEPTNGLDVTSSRAVHALIREMRDEGAAIVISSHIMSEVESLCDQLVIMADGRAALTGTAEELRARTGHGSLEDIFVGIAAGLEAAE